MSAIGRGMKRACRVVVALRNDAALPEGVTVLPALTVRHRADVLADERRVGEFVERRGPEARRCIRSWNHLLLI